MRRNRLIAAREKLLVRLPVTGELLRGSLLERHDPQPRPQLRQVRERRRAPGLLVLTVSYPGGRTRQLSVRRERVPEIRQWLSNYRELKAAIEAICELNHHLLRPDEAAPKRRRKRK